MSEREEVLNEFGTAECVKRDDCTHFDCVAERNMAEEIVRLRTALATAERERDEARRERDALRDELVIRGTAIKNLHSECDKQRHRAERMEIDHADALDAYRQMYESERDRAEHLWRVAEAARFFVIAAELSDSDDAEYGALTDALTALDRFDTFGPSVSEVRDGE